MTRLDIELVNRQICQTRSKAQMEIKNSNILVNRKTITKPAFNVESTDVITLNHEVLEYVSRGGLKLEKALNDFNIDFTTTLNENQVVFWKKLRFIKLLICKSKCTL